MAKRIQKDQPNVRLSDHVSAAFAIFFCKV